MSSLTIAFITKNDIPLPLPMSCLIKNTPQNIHYLVTLTQTHWKHWLEWWGVGVCFWAVILLSGCATFPLLTNSTGLIDVLILQATCTGKPADSSLQTILLSESTSQHFSFKYFSIFTFLRRTSTLPNKNPPHHLPGDCLQCNEIKCFHMKYSQLLPQLRRVLWCSKLM